VIGAFSQLGLLSVGTILELEINKAIWPNWTVLDRDFGDNQLFWWICLECYGAFGK